MEYLLAALVGGFLLFNSQASPKKVERAAENALRQRYPGAQVDVDIQGRRGMNVMRGKFQKVRVSIGGSQSSGGLVPLLAVPSARKAGHVGRLEFHFENIKVQDLGVETAEFAFNDVTYDWNALRKESLIKIVKSGPASARLVVGAPELQNIVQKRMGEATEVRLRLLNNKVRITGNYPAPLIGTPIPFQLDAGLEARQGNQIWLSQPQLSMGGVPVIAPAGNLLLRKVNPVYVFDPERQWAFRVQVNQLLANNDRLDIGGNLLFVPASP